jgi:hypothetical protein
MDRCREEPPPVLAAVGSTSHVAACHLDQAVRDLRGATVAAGGLAHE